LVLLEDTFATIINAIRDGRRIFENLRKAFTYLIAFQAPILLLALAIPLLGAPLLLLPVHIVWLELIMHPTASLVFENDPSPSDVMRRPPRKPGAGLLNRANTIRVLAEGLALFGGVLGLYLLRLAEDTPEPSARALALTTLMVGQVLLVLTERSPEQPIWQLGLRGNRALPAVLGVTLLSLLAALYLPWLADVLKLAPLSATDWLLAGTIAVITTLWLEPVKARRQRQSGGHARQGRANRLTNWTLNERN
jgi:Ca2+-transporting ATPase